MDARTKPCRYFCIHISGDLTCCPTSKFSLIFSSTELSVIHNLSLDNTQHSIEIPSFGPLRHQDAIDIVFRSECLSETAVENLSIPIACLDLLQPKTLKLSASDTDLSLQFELVEAELGTIPVAYPVEPDLNLLKLTDLYADVRKALVAVKQQCALVAVDVALIVEHVRQIVLESASMAFAVSSLVLEELLFKLDTMMLQITMKCDDIIEASALSLIKSIYNLRCALHRLSAATQQLVLNGLNTAKPVVHTMVKYSRPVQPVLLPLVAITKATVRTPIRLVFGRGALYQLCEGVVKGVEDFCTVDS